MKYQVIYYDRRREGHIRTWSEEEVNAGKEFGFLGEYGQFQDFGVYDTLDEAYEVLVELLGPYQYPVSQYAPTLGLVQGECFWAREPAQKKNWQIKYRPARLLDIFDDEVDAKELVHRENLVRAQQLKRLTTERPEPRP